MVRRHMAVRNRLLQIVFTLRLKGQSAECRAAREARGDNAADRQLDSGWAQTRAVGRIGLSTFAFDVVYVPRRLL